MTNDKRIFALGFFDGVHLGHQALLKECGRMAAEQDCQAAAITFDKHPQSLFVQQPPVLISTLRDRQELLRAYGMAHIHTFPVTQEVMSTPWQDFYRDLREMGAAGFVCGADFRFGHKGQGNARLLRLDAASRWKGVFTVVLANKDDSLANYHYSVREVSAVSDKVLNNWHPAVLENDGETILYYEKALENHTLLGINGRGYIVEYSKADGTHVVTNYKGYDMPETGGIGTYPYRIGGLIALATALIYGYSLRRKRERGASG